MISLEWQDDQGTVTVERVGVSHVTLTVNLEIVAYDPERDYLKITISGPFRMKRANTDWVDINPEADDPLLGEAIVALRYKPLGSCSITKSGTLLLEFGPALTLAVPSNGRYEAWELDHRTFKLICEAGGGVAVAKRDINAA
jgi:hypothetical protein